MIETLQVFCSKIVGKLFLVLVFIFISIFGYNQQLQIPIGSWRDHFSFINIRHIASGNNKLFGATSNAVMVKNESGLTKLSKINGLSSVGISCLSYSELHGLLIVGYEDGFMDLVSESKIISLDGIINVGLGSDLSINDFALKGDLAYSATSFGIIVIDLLTKQIKEVFSNIGPYGTELPIIDIEIAEDHLLVSTDNALLLGDISKNLLDFNNWNYFETIDDVQAVIFFEETIYYSSGSIIYKFEDGKFLLHDDLNFNIISMIAIEDKVYLLGDSNLLSWDGIEFVEIDMDFIGANALTIYDQNIAIATKNAGMKIYHESDNQSIVLTGPSSDEIEHMRYTDSLFIFYPKENADMYSVLFDKKWENKTIDSFHQITDVAGIDGLFYFSSLVDGVFQVSTNETYLTDENTIIPRMATTNGSIYALSNTLGQYLYKNDGNGWSEIKVPGLSSVSFMNILGSQAGYLWLINGTPSGGGIYVVDPDDPSKIRLIDKEDNLPSNSVNSVAIDLRDDAYIGTSSGISLLTNASFIFDDSPATVPMFENQVLFESTPISAVAIDGGNRKWIATSDGIWVFDEDLSLLERRFDVSNSSLISNNVKEMVYNGNSGEMFILTDIGLISYQTGSSAATLKNEDVVIFPNPVLPGFSGVVSISGLAYNANIKITSLNGLLIKDLKAIGGTATWDTTDQHFNFVASGIYIFFSSLADGQETFLGKIAIIR